MNKLLHERLRDTANTCRFVRTKGFQCYLSKDLACELVDEIEKYYDPKLHFEDGGLVNEGDKYVDQDGLECTISSIDKGTRIWDENGEFEIVDTHKPLKRPKPRVLDADGVEIKVGDTVWDLDSGEKLTVVEFANREHGVIQCSNEEDEYYGDHDANNLTHREPDSLEKLLVELRGVDFIPSKEYLNHIANRLIAIMERDV